MCGPACLLSRQRPLGIGNEKPFKLNQVHRFQLSTCAGYITAFRCVRHKRPRRMTFNRMVNELTSTTTFCLPLFFFLDGDITSAWTAGILPPLHVGTRHLILSSLSNPPSVVHDSHSSESNPRRLPARCLWRFLNYCLYNPRNLGTFLHSVFNRSLS